MQVRIVKMRSRGVELDRRMLRDASGTRGTLIVADVTDQGLHRPCKVARLLQDGLIRAELKDVSLVWANECRMTLAGYEQVQNETGQLIDYRQSWLIFIGPDTSLEPLPKRRVSPSN